MDQALHPLLAPIRTAGKQKSASSSPPTPNAAKEIAVPAIRPQRDSGFMASGS
jgi:hypothetical protein